MSIHQPRRLSNLFCITPWMPTTMTSLGITSSWSTKVRRHAPYSINKYINVHRTTKCGPPTQALPANGDVLLKLNGTSAQWCVGTCVPTLRACRNMCVTASNIVALLSLKVYAISLLQQLHCIGQNAQHGTAAARSRFFVNRCILAKICAKTTFTFPLPVTWAFTLWSKSYSAS